MEIIHTVKEAQEPSQCLSQKNGNLAFVPTMGALHEGHLSLIRRARAIANHVLVSIFVNPTQFNKPEDLIKYPRTDEEDLKKCESEGVDTVFMPSVEEMYPQKMESTIEGPDFTRVLCGTTRPGHFEGVATVVKRLFEIVQPTQALFGEKDYQQLLLIQWLVKEFNLPVKIISCPTIREADGLAMSSRNKRLSADERTHALALFQSTQLVKEKFNNGERNAMTLQKLAKDFLNKNPSITLDYAEIRDALTLDTIETIKQPALYAIAAQVGPVRLIDNCVL